MLTKRSSNKKQKLMDDFKFKNPQSKKEPIIVQVLKMNPLGLKPGKVLRSEGLNRNDTYELVFKKGPHKHLHKNYLKEI